MKILGIDSSAKTASVSITADGRVLALMYSNTGFTHSVTLMPMVQSALSLTGIDIGDIDAFAVSAGPGSFTGIRIGVSAIKGMAQPLNKPCIPVSALEAAAYPLREFDCMAISVMDARCHQVYEAEFRCGRGKSCRLIDDEAISIEQLFDRLKDVPAPIYFIGDGAKLCYDELSARLPGVRLAPEQMRFQSADSVALLAETLYNNNVFSAAGDIVPVYLRDSQAQRNLKKIKLPEE